MVPPKPDPSRKGDTTSFDDGAIFSESFTKGFFWILTISVLWIFLWTFFFTAFSVNSIRKTVNSIKDNVSKIEYTLEKEKQK